VTTTHIQLMTAGMVHVTNLKPYPRVARFVGKQVVNERSYFALRICIGHPSRVRDGAAMVHPAGERAARRLREGGGGTRRKVVPCRRCRSSPPLARHGAALRERQYECVREKSWFLYLACLHTRLEFSKESFVSISFPLLISRKHSLHARPSRLSVTRFIQVSAPHARFPPAETRRVCEPNRG
jgi:hypothetical protein